MARPKSDDKRTALLQAAARVIVTHGLSAPTALIAKEAGVANGTLFTYFPSKTDLLNQLYLELKREIAAVAQSGGDEEAPRQRLFRLWRGWMGWATSHPEKRRTLAQLAASEEIAPETREEANRLMEKAGALIERVRAEGPMRDAQREFVLLLTNSLMEATMDHMTQDLANADEHCRAGFDALWRVVGGS
jgi:AcrR family transcriptional regulator